ncbi:MAG: hypothetical protein Q8Q22_02060 [bacterium]|nr:hypothetical protein [bacterium]
MPENIVIQSEEEENLRKALETKNDAKSVRLKRFLDMPDLTRTVASPLYEMVQRIVNLTDFKGFDIIKVPEIVSTYISFDLFDFPINHPTRSHSDTYYVDGDHILRTQTTIMWYYYLNDENVKAKMARHEPVGAFCFGKVYRKDEIDRNHMNVFHQIDGWYLAPKDKEVLGKDNLQRALLNITQTIFGQEVKYRFNLDTFPYTDPSIEMEIDRGGKWLEICGAGIVKGSVLEKFGVDSSKWNGWAFGPGMERLAMISMDLPDIRLLWSDDERVKSQLKLGNKYKEVSKFPPIVRDISFVVDKDFVPNDYFDVIRDIGGNLIEQVELLDKYENVKKFSRDKLSYTFRITYRSLEKTLTNVKVNTLHAKLEEKSTSDFRAEIRRD